MKIKSVFLLFAVLLSSCSTVLTINEGNAYSGVKADIYSVKDTFNTTKPCYLTPHWAVGFLAAIDMPFSAVADTAVLPYTLLRKPRPSLDLDSQQNPPNRQRKE